MARLQEAKESRKDWDGEERRRAKDLKETGDHTLERIEEQAKQALKQAGAALAVAKGAREAVNTHTTAAHGETRRRSKFMKWVEILFPLVWPIILNGVVTLFSYLAILAKLAEAAKASGGHP